jgi:hypothetical protein
MDDGHRTTVKGNDDGMWSSDSRDILAMEEAK